MTPPLQPPPPPGLDAWRSLVSFRPPAALQLALAARAWPLGSWWKIHALENAHGPLNLDYYPVRVSSFPSVSGHVVTPEELLNHFRLNLNALVSPQIAEFSPYDAVIDGVNWGSTQPPSPLGSVVHIDMMMGGDVSNVDDGSVLVSDVGYDHWIFSTISTPKDFEHPVSGNRWFGFFKGEGGSATYFTRGADRCTGYLDVLMQDTVFLMAHALWMSFQQGIADWVNKNGGVATIGSATSLRYAWDPTKSLYYSPSESWVIQP